MSRHYSRQEKEKWVEEPRPPPKRPPVRIPESNNESLIAANRLTIIGRVTNPQVQRPRAVVDFLPQVWHLEGRVNGRDLGADKFQFKFETEEELATILHNGPYHYKKWMLLIQRWEPVVSDQFPSTISFWVNIIGIPLHFWNDKTVDTIEDALGNYPVRDIEGARLRMDANGLLPLEMTLDIELPSGDVTEVELEYLKLEKHCFQCYSLLHEKDDCPLLVRGAQRMLPRKMGINQRNALMRIEANKRCHDERCGYSRIADTRRSVVSDQHRRAPSAYEGRRTEPDRARSRVSHSHGGSRGYHSDRRTREYSDRRAHEHPDQSRDRSEYVYRPREITSAGRKDTDVSGSLGRNLGTRLSGLENAANQVAPNGSQASHTPPRPVEQPQDTTANSGSSKERRSALERISEPRPPALARLGVTSSNDSVRLQDVEIEFLGDEDQEILTRRLSQTSTGFEMIQIAQNVPAITGGVPTAQSEESPEDLAPNRIHPSLRLGARVASPGGGKRKAPASSTAAKATGKRKVTKPPAPKRIPRSPCHGVSLRKVNVARSLNPPRKKLCLDKAQAGPSKTTMQTRSSNTVQIPANRRKEGDFQSPLPPLP
ncbi:PREDICTED: uncharacterized protein LOC106338573 [Brassica oleracea var. oleracea]|uniref:uncharacterized protein LOC106338573 n=1 Tax=Brassica oleracea var. oleracea TaxID=109376 RepID=UPI0006A75027|nr:PREDICTED: uncharacterized protein LOC106338573 [Brassica oleracea var. oleracea]